jgi:hypothetical protein
MRELTQIVERLGVSESQAIAAVISAFPKKTAALLRKDAASEKSHVPEPKPVTRSTTSPLMWRGIPVGDMLAFPSGLAARLIGVSRSTFWRDVKLGKIRQQRHGLVTRDELLRYLREENP